MHSAMSKINLCKRRKATAGCSRWLTPMVQGSVGGYVEDNS